jgi:hypothetical protein
LTLSLPWLAYRPGIFREGEGIPQPLPQFLIQITARAALSVSIGDE